MLGMLIVLGLSFHCSDKGFGDALKLGIDAVLEAITESKSRMPECGIHGESNARRL